MASLLRNVARKNFVNFLEVLNATILVSPGQIFLRGGNVFRVSSHLLAFNDSHSRESHSEQRRNFPFTVFAVLGITAATSKSTEEDSLPTSSVSQTLSVTTPSPPSHHLKRRSNGRFAKATKGTSNKMALMKQGYRNYLAKGNWVLKTQSTKTNHPLNATQGLLMYARR